MRPNRYITFALILLAGLAICLWLSGSLFNSDTSKDPEVAGSTASDKTLAQKVKKLEKEVAKLPKGQVKQIGLFNKFTPPSLPQPKETDPIKVTATKGKWSDEVSLRIGWAINWKTSRDVTSLLIKADDDLIEQNEGGYWKIEGDKKTKLASQPNAANWRFKVPPTYAKDSFVVEIERKPM